MHILYFVLIKVDTLKTKPLCVCFEVAQSLIIFLPGTLLKAFKPYAINDNNFVLINESHGTH